MTYLKNIRKPLMAAILGATALTAMPAMADQVFNDDVIVVGSLCVGIDCVNGENFGFDTIRLKENNLRIGFTDTSSTSSFPSNDWQITINDSANGGANKFSIDDITGGRTPFTIEASAPSNSLFVDDGGRVGFGTATPVVDLHVVSGNTPTLRLAQDGSSGFTPQTWDMAGNETNFFIRDATNGSTLPFRIRPGAPSESIFVAGTGATAGNVGFGTSSPDDDVEITDAAPTLLFEETGTGAGDKFRFRLDDGLLRMAYVDGLGTEATLDTGGKFTVFGDVPEFALDETGAGAGPDLFRMRVDAGTFRMAFADGLGTEFEMDTSGNVTIQGTITTSGSCSTPCDGVFDADYELPSIEQHAEYMFANRHLEAVGPTQTGPIDLSDKVLKMLNELEKAHIYIAQLNERIEELESQQ